MTQIEAKSNTQVQVFENSEFGKVRTVMGNDGEPWFVAVDIAGILGFETASDAVRGLEEDEKGMKKMPTPGGEQIKKFIPEGDHANLGCHKMTPMSKKGYGGLSRCPRPNLLTTPAGYATIISADDQTLRIPIVTSRFREIAIQKPSHVSGRTWEGFN